MSLFPAYSDGDSVPWKCNEQDIKQNDAVGADKLWLTNPSFSLEISQIPLPGEKKGQTVVSETSAAKRQTELPEHHKERKASSRKKVKSYHKQSRKKKEDYDISIPADSTVFYEDKTCEKGNLLVVTLARPAVPLYRVCHGSSLSWSYARKSPKKRKHLNRYFTHFQELSKSLEESTSGVTEDTIAVANGNKLGAKKQQVNDGSEFSGDMQLEEELSKNTAQYNRILTEQPCNVELWLKYVHFQDVISQFENTYRRGGGAAGARVRAERKLAILDKALLHNPDSEVLLKERFAIAEAIFPADIISRQLGGMLEKQPSNLALWHGYISATQCSLAMCTVPAVMQLYNRAMARLHQLRRGAPTAQTKPSEEKILALLHDCGLFLRQAGLWEQLWLLLRMYLELNLSQPDSSHFKISSTLSEQIVTESEERILASELPLLELWLRVEQLREGAHWLPWASDEDCEDPQRLVFSDDVSDLLHPITTVSLLPHLATVVLTLLKVPVLPCRDTALRIINRHQTSWSLDTVEMLLPAFFPMGTVELECIGLFKDISQLAVGPQYLDQRLGQEHYLEFVTKVFRLCGDCLAEPSRTAFCVWWLRFERLLLVLDRLGISSLPQSRKKKVKSAVKEFLKQDQNRNNLLFYREYALIEWELGNRDGACKILTTVIVAQPGALPVVSMLNEQEKSGLGSLYRTLCELYLSHARLTPEDASTHKQKAISVLIALGLGKPLSKTECSVEQQVAALDKFYHIGAELLEDASAEAAASVDGHLVPDFCVDWMSCHAWLLFLTQSTWAGGAVIENVLAKIPPASSSMFDVTVMSCRREALFESYVDMLHHHCSEAPGTYSILREVLQRAIKEFPNNVYLLTTAAKLESGVGGIGGPWWKVTRYFIRTHSVMAHLFLVLLARQRQYQQDDLVLQMHNSSHTAGPFVPDKSAKNRLQALFTVLKNDPLTKRCPLIWRMYLRFLYDHGTELTRKTAFYRAVEECPWVKALYIDAAKHIPEELPQVQDLIIEKELRLHVTPEELDILRGESS